MNIPDHISESLKQFLGLKILKFFDADPGPGIFLTRIRNGKTRSGINIPDPHATLATVKEFSNKNIEYIKQKFCTASRSQSTCLKESTIIPFMFPDALIYQYVQHLVTYLLLKSTNLVSTQVRYIYK